MQGDRDFLFIHQDRRTDMPILLWLLGVPLSLVIILALTGVI